MIVHFAEKEKGPYIQLYTNSWIWPAIWLNGQEFVRNMFGKLVIKQSWDRSIDMGKTNVNTFASHGNVHQRVISAGEEFNNQADKVTNSVDTS